MLQIVLVTECTLGVVRNYPLKTPFPGSVLILSTRSRNLAGNPDSPQAVIFLASITDVMMGS